MPNTGRKRDIVWLSFDEIKNESRKGIRAKCKLCDKELEGQVSRMKIHLSQCTIRCEDTGKFVYCIHLTQQYITLQKKIKVKMPISKH